jgi:hypothetical protein
VLDPQVPEGYPKTLQRCGCYLCSGPLQDSRRKPTRPFLLAPHGRDFAKNRHVGGPIWSAHDTSSFESSESDHKEEGGEASEGTEGQNQAEENAGAEQATAYVRCENVKQ